MVEFPTLVKKISLRKWVVAIRLILAGPFELKPLLHVNDVVAPRAVPGVGTSAFVNVGALLAVQ